MQKMLVKSSTEEPQADLRSVKREKPLYVIMVKL